MLETFIILDVPYSLTYVSANVVNFYRFIPKFYDNNLGGPVIIKQCVERPNSVSATNMFWDPLLTFTVFDLGRPNSAR